MSFDTQPLIGMHDVTYTYENGVNAVKGVNLNIYDGEIVGIMGMNGAGKTTLFRMLNGLIRPSNGTIIFECETIAEKTIAQLSQSIGIIFQNPEHQLFANTIEEEIEFSLKSLKLNSEEIRHRVDAVLSEFKLGRYRKRSPLNLSGGETKKLAVASIICRDPRVIVFDEPTLGQDARELELFTNLLYKEKRGGKTIIIVTHNVEYALEHIPRTILMSNGEIIADGPTDALLKNESLIKKASLTLPQVRRFSLELERVGINPPKNLTSRAEMVEFLIDYMKNESSSGMGGD